MTFLPSKTYARIMSSILTIVVVVVVVVVVAVAVAGQRVLKNRGSTRVDR